MTQTAAILVVDDEKLIRLSLADRLGREGYEVAEAAGGGEAREAFENRAFDLVLLDQRLPDATGTELLASFLAREPDLPVILMTAYSTVLEAVRAIQIGALDYVTKPFDMDRMILAVEKALETTRLERELRHLRRQQDRRFGFSQMVGRSRRMQEVFALVAKLNESGASTVLIEGENGTGKDLLARTIHNASDRAAMPFVTVTCTALPEKLLESELFGHERGAFTDAREQKKGLLEIADRGTVFLDEIGDMPGALQAKLLRFLEEKTFRRVGGMRDISIDTRIIAATNRDLAGAVAARDFREDLFYRLNVVPIHLPPLRERFEDIELLVQHYIDLFNRELRRRIRGVSPAALQLLKEYSWPGNVRELRNVVERAMILRGDGTIETDDLPGEMHGAPVETGGPRFRLPRTGMTFRDFERDLVSQALEMVSGNQTRAATLLGMTRDQIRYRIEKFGLYPSRR